MTEKPGHAALLLGIAGGAALVVAVVTATSSAPPAPAVPPVAAPVLADTLVEPARPPAAGLGETLLEGLPTLTWWEEGVVEPERTAPPQPAAPVGPPSGAVPVEVVIPGMGVTAPVVPVGLDSGGGVFVPEDVRTLGWYSASVLPAAAEGSSVIVGHRDSAVQGAGALSGIENLSPGERIEVRTLQGELAVFEVSEVELVEKSNFDSIVRDAFGTTGEHRLTLITCGGAFDSAARSYISNVIVTAVPVT